MTAAQTAYLKATGGEQSSTPAEVGKRIIEGVLQRELPEERTELLNSAMHWAYGTSWGAWYGLVAGSRRRADRPRGLAFGLVVWSASRVELPAMKLAPPVWKYRRRRWPRTSGSTWCMAWRRARHGVCRIGTGRADVRGLARAHSVGYPRT